MAGLNVADSASYIITNDIPQYGNDGAPLALCEMGRFPNFASKVFTDIQSCEQRNFFTIQVTAKVSIIQEPNHCN